MYRLSTCYIFYSLYNSYSGAFRDLFHIQACTCSRLVENKIRLRLGDNLTKLTKINKKRNLNGFFF